MKNFKEAWEKLYDENKYTMKFPDEPTIRFFGKISKKIELNGKGLDVGSGMGRNCRLMYEFGIDAYGIEISEMAIKRAKEYMKLGNFKAQFILYDGIRIPFEDRYFDYVISHGVLDSMTFENAQTIINEIYRVLKSDGYSCIVVHSDKDSSYGEGKKIEENTFIIKEGFEKDTPQHYFTLDEIKELFGEFEIIDVGLHEDIQVDLNTGNPKKKG